MTPDEMAVLHARAFEPGARGWRAEEFSSLLADVQIVVAGTQHAFALARVAADEAEILTIVCSPTHRRQGFATSCLSDIIARSRARGVRRCYLEVASNNHAARALYEKMGFGQVGRRVNYYGCADEGRADALVMELRLD